MIAKRERARQLAMASAGQKALKSRIQAKKGRMNEIVSGKRRHEEAMAELARRRAAQSKRKTTGPGPGIGISAGIKTKNKHMAEFQSLKDGHNKRKGNVLLADNNFFKKLKNHEISLICRNFDEKIARKYQSGL
jgi:hypothetical protein